VGYTLLKASPPSHATKIQEELLQLLKAKDEEKVFEYIDVSINGLVYVDTCCFS